MDFSISEAQELQRVTYHRGGTQYLLIPAKAGTYKAMSHIGEPGSLQRVSTRCKDVITCLTLLHCRIQSGGAMHVYPRFGGSSRRDTEHTAKSKKTARRSMATFGQSAVLSLKMLTCPTIPSLCGIQLRRLSVRGCPMKHGTVWTSRR